MSYYPFLGPETKVQLVRKQAQLNLKEEAPGVRAFLKKRKEKKIRSQFWHALSPSDCKINIFSGRAEGLLKVIIATEAPSLSPGWDPVLDQFTIFLPNKVMVSGPGYTAVLDHRWKAIVFQRQALYSFCETCRSLQVRAAWVKGFFLYRLLKTHESTLFLQKANARSAVFFLTPLSFSRVQIQQGMEENLMWTFF